MWDAVEVGGGPAGLSAATRLGRDRRRTLLLDGDEHPPGGAGPGYLTRDRVAPGHILEAGRSDLGASASSVVLLRPWPWKGRWTASR